VRRKEVETASQRPECHRLVPDGCQSGRLGTPGKRVYRKVPRVRIPPHPPHPAAEKLFAAAWSACFIGAIELAASRKKIPLPAHPSIDAEIDLITADDAFFLRARL